MVSTETREPRTCLFRTWGPCTLNLERPSVHRAYLVPPAAKPAARRKTLCCNSGAAYGSSSAKQGNNSADNAFVVVIRSCVSASASLGVGGRCWAPGLGHGRVPAAPTDGPWKFSWKRRATSCVNAGRGWAKAKLGPLDAGLQLNPSLSGRGVLSWWAVLPETRGWGPKCCSKVLVPG